MRSEYKGNAGRKRREYVIVKIFLIPAFAGVFMMSSFTSFAGEYMKTSLTASEDAAADQGSTVTAIIVSGEHGTVNEKSGKFSEIIRSGEDLQLEISAEEGYEIDSVLINEEPLADCDMEKLTGKDSGTLELEELSEDLNVEVLFVPDREAEDQSSVLQTEDEISTEDSVITDESADAEKNGNAADSDKTPDADKTEDTDKTADAEKNEKTDEAGNAGKSEEIDEAQGADKSEETDEAQDADKSEETDEAQDAGKSEETDETQNDEKNDEIYVTQDTDKSEVTDESQETDETEDTENNENTPETEITERTDSNEVPQAVENEEEKNDKAAKDACIRDDIDASGVAESGADIKDSPAEAEKNLHGSPKTGDENTALKLYCIAGLFAAAGLALLLSLRRRSG